MKRKNSILFAILLLLGVSAYAQAPWVRTFGGANDEKGNDLILMPDSGFLAVGFTGSSGMGASDVYMVRTDSMGLLLWQKTVGTINVDIASRIVAANTPGDYLIGGYSNGLPPYEYDFYVIKTDSNGDTLWTRNIGTPEWDFCYDLCAMANSYILVGETYQNSNQGTQGYIVRMDDNGDTLFTRMYQSPYNDVFKAIVPLNASECLIAGYRYNELNETSDGLVLKMDTAGNFLDTLILDFGYNEYINCMAASYGNGIMLGGYYHYDTTEFSMSLQVKLDDNGNYLWQLMAPQSSDWGVEINDYGHYQNDEFYFVSESHYKYNTDKQAMFFLGMGNGLPQFFKENGIIGPVDGFFGSVLTPNKDIVATGYTQSYGPGTQALIISKMLKDGTITNSFTIGLDEEKEAMPFGLFPNPAENFFSIGGEQAAQVRILDMSGRQLMQAKKLQGSVLTLDASAWPAGIYLVCMQADNGKVFTAKLCKK
ncbi:MAG: T9SS type A sorting domain-containing protein [Bacteroidia bacterium]|nr:T9SS type A sorting domain-containing protein [Bacteroidia bacterium]